LVAWEEYGAVLASYLVRKPGAATLAMAINGFGQYFLVDGLQGPHHLIYFVSGLSADLIFGLFRYKRYDIATCVLAGIASQMFWIPVHLPLPQCIFSLQHRFHRG
jgi:ABC-type thiamin/hydroxymethylpyrimidine transport system permease subunit